MSAPSDPVDFASARGAEERRRRSGAGVFLAWIGACALCLVAGAAIGRFGLGGGPAAPGGASATAPPAREASAPSPAPPASLAAAPTPAAAAGPAPAAPDASALAGQLARLQASQAGESRAALLALAAAELSAAAESGAPFAAELAGYARLAPDDPTLAALEPLAARGAPSRATLAAALRDLTPEAAAAARGPGDSPIGRIMATLGRVVIVRRIDVGAPGVDGTLARAEAAAAAGDLATAVSDIARLPPAARGPLDDWLAAARRRIAIDDDVERLRGQAAAGLAAAGVAR